MSIMCDNWNRHDPDEPSKRLWDAGIRSIVMDLEKAGITVVDACEGGPTNKHAALEAHVHVAGQLASAGWEAFAVARAQELPVIDVSMHWYIIFGVPRGPMWRLTFALPKP